MRFFRKSVSALFVLAFAFQANASDLLGTITTREYGNCETNNLRFTAMKFYKIPLKSPDKNLFLRALFFFNDDQTFRLRLTRQLLLGCQTLPSGDLACSYRPVGDLWMDGKFSIEGEQIIDTPVALISKVSDDLNRGFTIRFKDEINLDIDSPAVLPGGMVETNFNQYGKNTINICRQ